MNAYFLMSMDISLRLIVTVLLICLWLAPAQAQEQVGFIYQADGESFMITNSKKVTALDFGHKISITDTLVTGDDGFIEFQFMESSRIHLKPGSRLLFNSTEHLNQSELRMKLLSGEMLVEVAESPHPMQVTTPTAIASTRHASYTVEIAPDGSTVFTGINGSVEVTAASSGETQMLARRNKLSTDMRGQYFTVQHISNREVNSVIQIYNSFNRRPAERPGH